VSAHLLTGVRPYGEDAADILLVDGAIAAVGPDAAALAPADAVRHDLDGLIALPGLVDIHTHLREPGRESAETVFTGTRAAAVGGYTAVFAMANTTPVQDSAGVVEQVLRLGREAGWVDVHPVGAVSAGLKGEHLSEMSAMAHCAARVRVFSDDGRCVSDPVLMRRALEYVKSFDGVIAQHAQDPRLTEGSQMHEGAVSAELGLRGWPAVAEESIIARDVLLAEHVGSRLHVCHLSTAGSVDIIRWAKARGIDVTAEATPHHLLLTDEMARTYSPRYKVNPPLRENHDTLALRQALLDGIIDCVSTDHAPHGSEDKCCEFEHARPGMLGLETSLPIIADTFVRTGAADWRWVARVMSEKPAEIVRLPGHGRPIAVGEPANLTIVDPDCHWVAHGEDMASKADNTPYEGMEFHTKVTHTILRGRVTCNDGVAAEPRTQA